MVSTRGVKLKFGDGERVLCYEPDPTKAKVLYDSKVLEVVVTKDQRGRKTVEYLIHFQGWNSSWDRCVSEDFVLKDTAENRQLQRDLAEKSQLQLGAYLYRRDKKRTRKFSDRVNENIAQCSEEGSSGSPAMLDTDDTQPSSSESDTSIEDEAVPLELTQTLRYWVELDNELIVRKNKVVRLPAEPNVLTILEGYLKQYATCQTCGISEKPKTRHRHSKMNKPRNVDNIYRNLNVCKELVDGIRVYFDFTLNDLLLYNQERQQDHWTAHNANFNRLENHHGLSIKMEQEIEIKIEDTEDYSHLPKLLPDDNSYIYDEMSRESVGTGSRRSSTGAAKDSLTPFGGSSPRRRLRSSRISQHSESATDGSVPVETNGFNYDSVVVKQEFGGNMSSIASTESDSSGPLSQVQSWKLIPEEVISQTPQLPSHIYGAIHLVRLLVKLPELLWAANIPEGKLKLLLRHLDLFVDYLDEHREWFGEKYYTTLSMNQEL